MAVLIYSYMELHLAFREDMKMHLLQVQVTGVNALLIPKGEKHIPIGGRIPQDKQLYWYQPPGTDTYRSSAPP